ncbi:hypothetical protein E4U42_004930 [Claviceps africana]|uniref:Uracil-DNA glycosylase-like domain-containing protein n=1 Tax=Claviceps africana TaxID=83212 RepID=A0A8K0NHU2_9HYPO|nr:hypothetical protein E4U42_004930 [Claviceps africana]
MATCDPHHQKLITTSRNLVETFNGLSANFDSDPSVLVERNGELFDRLWREMRDFAIALSSLTIKVKFAQMSEPPGAVKSASSASNPSVTVERKGDPFNRLSRDIREFGIPLSSGKMTAVFAQVSEQPGAVKPASFESNPSVTVERCGELFRYLKEKVEEFNTAIRNCGSFGGGSSSRVSNPPASAETQETQLDLPMSKLVLKDSKTDCEKKWDEVIRLAKKIRRNICKKIWWYIHPSLPVLSDSEKEITKQLASPFTTGGLLVLLLQPRSDHRWDEGLDDVIKCCPSLALVDEELQLCGTDLRNDVSLVDIWACLPKEITTSHEFKTGDSFRQLVVAAIRAKKPDCILCMGMDPLKALKEDSRWHKESETRGQWCGIPVVDTFHPSFVLRGPTSTKRMEREFRFRKDIRDACDITRKSKVQEWQVFRFTQVLAQCCFRPCTKVIAFNRHKHRRGLYVIKEPQKDWLNNAKKIGNGTFEEEARKRLIPFLEKLNDKWVRESWFKHRYGLENKAEIPNVVPNKDLAAIEDDCYTVAGHGLEEVEKSNILAPRNSQDPSQLDDEDLSERLVEIASYTMRLWKKNKLEVLELENLELDRFELGDIESEPDIPLD